VLKENKENEENEENVRNKKPVMHKHTGFFNGPK